MKREQRIVLALSAATALGFGPGADAATVMFDFGVSNDSGAFQQAGWTQFELSTGSNAAPITSSPDAVEGWSVTLTPAGGSGNIGGRNRDNGTGMFDATTGGTFTLDNVYIDFIVSWEKLSINNLDPSKTYDVQLIMFDDNVTDGRTQSVTNTTGGASDFLGTTAGPGTGSGGVLDSDLVYSVFGTGLSPDGSGVLEFTYTNSATGDRAITNGLIITEVPEPASLGVLSLGASLLLLRRRRAF